MIFGMEVMVWCPGPNEKTVGVAHPHTKDITQKQGYNVGVTVLLPIGPDIGGAAGYAFKIEMVIQETEYLEATKVVLKKYGISLYSGKIDLDNTQNIQEPKLEK